MAQKGTKKTPSEKTTIPSGSPTGRVRTPGPSSGSVASSRSTRPSILSSLKKRFSNSSRKKDASTPSPSPNPSPSQNPSDIPSPSESGRTKYKKVDIKISSEVGFFP